MPNEHANPIQPAGNDRVHLALIDLSKFLDILVATALYVTRGDMLKIRTRGSTSQPKKSEKQPGILPAKKAVHWKVQPAALPSLICKTFSRRRLTP